MRSSLSIVKATALEILSEPLSLLVLLAALSLTTLAPAFHYHQFGEASRMARDAGLSAIFTCGAVIAVFGTIRTFRREIESGTLAMALVRPVSRSAFFLSKACGAFVAYLVFAVVVLGTAMVMVEGAEIGGLIARRSGDVARIFGPCLAGATAIIVVPLVLGAVLNRFGRFRFVLTAFALAFALAVIGGGAVGVIARGRILRLLPVTILLCVFSSVLLSASAAFAIRLKANAAASAAGVVLLALLPAVGNYYMADALAKGGSVPWAYVGCAALAAVPAVLLFLFLGIHFINGQDVS